MKRHPLRCVMHPLIAALSLQAALGQDEHTLLLCHFDGTTAGAGLSADIARGSGAVASASGCRLVDGKEGKAVEIGTAGDGSHLYYSGHDNFDWRQGTIEFWVKLNWDCSQNESRLVRVWFDVGSGESKNRILIHSNHRALRFAVCDTQKVMHAVYSTSFREWRQGEWRHVAGTWDLKRKAVAMWVDGRLEDQTPSNPKLGNWELDPKEFTVIRMGAFGNIDSAFGGAIDDLHISNSVRYHRPKPTAEQLAALAARQAEAKKALASLHAAIATARGRGVDTAYLDAVATAGATGLWRMERLPRKPSYEQSSAHCDYILARCADARAGLADILSGEKTAVRVPRHGVVGLKVAGDAFKNAQGEPALLLGVRNMLADELPELSTFFNIDTCSWETDEALGDKRARNVCVQVHLFWNGGAARALKDHEEMRNVGGYSGHNWARGLCVESPMTRRAIEESIAGLRPIQRGEDPSYLYALLSAEDRYMCYCDRSIGRFRQWAADKYGDIGRLNAAWGATYQDFRQLDAPRLRRGKIEPNNRAAWYDWQCFNRDRVTDFYLWLKSVVRRSFPRLPLNAGTHTHLATSRFGTMGVDSEAVERRVNDVIQAETQYGLPTYRPSGPQPRYGMDIYGEALLDFKRCVSNKPATDLEFHAWLKYTAYLKGRGDVLPRGYTSAVLYRHFLHGIRAANVWVWNRKPSAVDDPASFGCSPAIPLYSVEECLRAALDIRRLTREIIALSRAAAEVAILVSDATFMQVHPSFIKAWHQAAPCTVELNNVCQGSMFLDAPVGFVTERMLALGQAGRYKIILVPGVSHCPRPVFDAIMKYVDDGGTVLTTPRSFRFDEYNRVQPYLGGLVDVRRTVITGLVREPAPDMFDDPEFVERQVVDPADARVPTTEIRATGEGVLRGPGLSLHGAGIRETIAARRGRVIARFADGEPAIVSIPRGKGRVYYAAMQLKPQSYSTLLDAILDDLKVRRPVRLLDKRGHALWGVEARACDYKGGTLVYAINLLAEPVDVRVAADKRVTAVHDLITGKNLGERFTLAGLQTVILRLNTDGK